MKPKYHTCVLRLALATSISLCVCQASKAASVYWDTNGTTAGSGAAAGTWGSSAFWTTTEAGTATPNGTLPTANDDVFIAAGTTGTAGTITISGAQVAGSLTLQEPAANPGVTISGGTSLTLGGGSSATKGLFVTGNGTHTVSTALILNGANTIQNAGTGTLTVNGGLTGTGNLTLNNNSTGATGITLSSVAINNTGTISNAGTSSGTVVIGNANAAPGVGAAGLGANVTSISQDSATSPLQFLNANNSAFAGSYNINAGTLQFSGTNTSGTVTATNAASVINLGATSGTAAATLAIGNNAVSGKLNNNINVRAGSTGVKTMITVSTSTSFATSGLVTLDDNLTLTPPGLTTFGFTFNNSIVDGSSGPKGITKSGAGSVYLAASNTYSGATSLTNGTLQLTGATGSLPNTSGIFVTGGTFQLNNTAAANNTNRIPDSTVISMSSGALDFKNDAGAATNFSETIALTTVGAVAISASQAAAAQSSTLTIGTFTRTQGSTLAFSGTGLGVDARNVILFSTPPTLANGVIPWATYAGTSFASYDVTNGVTSTTATDIDAQGSTIADNSTSNLRILNDGSGASIALGSTTTSINTLVQANVGAAVSPTIDTISKTLRVNGILLPSTTNTRPLTIGATANDGVLTAGTSGGELVLFNNSASALTLNAVIADNTTASSVSKSGTGNITFAGTNTYTGNTTLTGGIITAANSSAFGTGAVTLNPTTTRLVINDGLTLASNITFKGGGVSSRGIFENSSTGEATLSGTITIDGTLAGGGHFASATGGTLKVTGPVNSTGPAVSSRIGTVIFSGGGSYANFTLNEGTVRLGATNGLSTSAQVDVGASGTAILDLAGFDQSLAGLFRSSGNSATVGNSSTTTDSTLTTTGVSSYSGTITNVVSTGTRKTNLVVNSGTFTLTGAFSGDGVTVNNGATLAINAAAGDGFAPTSRLITVNNGGILRYTGANKIQNDTIIDVKSGGVFDANGQADSIGYVNGAGSITNMNGTLTLTGPAVGSGSDFSGTITGTGIINFIANGTGASSASTLTLSNANDIGGVTVAGGRVIARNTGAFGTAGKTVTVGAAALTLAPTVEFATDTTVNKYILSAGSGNTGTFVLNRATSGATITHEMGVALLGNATLNFEKGSNVTGTPVIQFDGINASAGFAGTMVLNPTSAVVKVLSSGTVSIGTGSNPKGINLGGTTADNEIAAPITNGLNTLSLTKSNISTWTIGNTNTYTGPTTVLGGTLNLNGSIGASSAVTVGGATATGTPTLTGTGGTVNGSLTIAAAGGGAAGIINPGTAGTLGTLNAGGTTIAGTYACDVNTSGTDLVAVTGNLDITGATLALNVISSPAAGSYNIATYTGALSGTFTPVPALPSGYAIDYSTAGVIKLTVPNTATPYETWGLPYGLTAGTGGGDLDNDGLTNFQEFAFGLIPNSGSSVNPITSQLNKTTGQFTYQRLAASGLNYTIWTSPDLVTWTQDVTAVQTPTAAAPNESVQVTLSASIPLSAGKLFVRVKAE